MDEQPRLIAVADAGGIMQGSCRTRLFHAMLAGALSAVVVGCGSTTGGGAKPALYQQPDPSPRGQQPAGGPEVASPGPAEMQRLIARLESLETDNAQLKQQLSDQYMQAIALRRQQLENQKRDAAAAEQPAADEARPQASRAEAPTADKPRADPAAMSRMELLDALVGKIVEGRDDARTKALMVAAISVASQRHELDHRLLEQLDPRAREQVARFHQMLAVTYDELAGDPGRTITRREMIAKIDKVFGAQPLSIEALELCRVVKSYGVYEPFGSTRFLAGRKNKLLVYVELENFHHEPTKDGQYQVKLEQQIELYDATGETTVWRQGPVELIDVSRNKRRDFFIVYPIELPARLTAGAYRLKVRVADKHTGSICEQTLHDIQIVADRALVGGQ